MTIFPDNLHKKSVYKKYETKKHIIREGARTHVLWWDFKGRHCSEENCEVNKNE